MKNFIMENKVKLLLGLIITILVATACVYNIVNKPKEIAKVENGEIKASVETVPDGYIGIYDANGLRNMANNLSGNYILMADIDMTGEPWTPIGTMSNKFRGKFEGNYHTISNLTINSSAQYIGLFGIATTITVQNLTLENVNIQCTTNSQSYIYIGAVVGNGERSISIDNVKLVGTNTIQNIYGVRSSYIGGLVGLAYDMLNENNNIITNSSVIGDITANVSGTYGDAYVGGLVGEIKGGTISDSYAIGTVTANASRKAYVGGIAGRTSTTVKNSYAKSIVKANGVNKTSEGKPYTSAGGLIGYANSSVSNTYATSSVESTQAAGGLIGYADGCTTINSHATGDVVGVSYVGGLFGGTYMGSTSNTYATGKVIGDYNVGGLIGEMSCQSGGTTSNSYAISEVIGKSGVGGLIGYQVGGTTSNTYAIGKVTGESSVGGLVGTTYSAPSINNSYYSPKLTGCETSDGGTAKSTQELLYENTYTNWDFTNIWAIEPNGGSLAYLRAFELPEEITKEEVDYETRVGLTRIGTDGVILTDGKYQVKNSVGEVVREGGTNSKGIFWIKDLEVGTYTVEETVTPVGYVEDKTVYPFKITEGGKAVNVETGEEITLQIQTAPLTIAVQSRDDITEQGIQGITIGLYNEDGTEVIGKDGKAVTKVTDAEGKVSFTKVLPGTYKYKQTTTPKGYKENYTEYTVILSTDGTAMYVEENEGIIYNEKIRADVTITIKDGETDEALVGAIIGIYDSNKNEIIGEDGRPIQKVTNENGQVTFEKLEPGTYYYEEVQAPEGYERDENKYKFVVNEDGTITFYGAEGEELGKGTNVTIRNTVQNGVVIIKKRHIYGKRTYPVKGAIIGLYSLNGEKILDNNGNHIKRITDSNGNAVFYGLQAGTYQYREILAPVGYRINNNMYKFRISEEGKVTYVENNGIIYDEYATYGITIGNRVESLENIGITIYPIGGGQNIHKTIANGENINIGRLPVGGYEYRIDGDNNTYGFTINGDGSINHVGGNGIFIGNNNIKTDVPIETGREEGTRIYLYDKEGNGIYNENGDHVTIITDGNGYGTFSNLEEGEYQYKIEGDDNTYGFIITEDGEIIYKNENGKVIVNLSLTKYRTGTTIPLKGATIGIYNQEETLIKQGITNEQGKVTFTKVEEGSYTYKEIQAPIGYVLNGTTYTVTITNKGKIVYGENSNGIIYNDRIKSGNIVIGAGVPGVEIGIYDKEGNAVIGTDGNPIKGTTGEDGKVILGGVEPGDYIYKVTEVPEGYKPDEKEYHFNVDEEGNITFEDGEGNIVSANIRKISKSTKLGLQGAKIVLIDENGQETTGTTNEEGYVTFIGLQKGKTYTYKEVEAPIGYVLNTNVYTLTVNEDGSITYGENGGIIENERIKVNVGIIKYEEGTTKPVQGAKIGLFDQNGNQLTNKDGAEIILTTNENGQVVFENLGEGTYYYKETEAPLGYVLNDTMYTFKVEKNGNVIYGTNKGIIYNTAMKYSVAIVKYITGTEIPVQGAVIGLFDENGNPLTNQDGAEITATTNEQGQVVFENLGKGTYYYKETEAPVGYVLNEETYTFIVNKDGTITYGENNGIIYNNTVKTSVVIKKYILGTTTPLEGASITLYDAEGNEITVKQTGKDGQVLFENLEKGTYYYKETIAPTGYALNEETYQFTINTDGTVVYGENGGIIYNDLIRANAIIKKYEEGTEIPVQGAVIGLFDENGNALVGPNEEQIKATTGPNGTITILNLTPGTYCYKELQAPVGYVLNNTMYTFTVNEKGEVIYGDLGGIIYNTPKTIDVEIIKMEKDTNKPLKGATIKLYKERQEEELQTITTGENGKGKFFGLRVGTYYYKETKAPIGYLLNNITYTFTVNADGTITYGENNGIIYNKKKPEDPTDPTDPEEPDTPETPDKPTDPNKPTEPNTPSKPEEPTDPNVPVNPVKPDKPNGNYTGLLPKTGETIAVLIIAVIALSSSGIILTYSYMRMRKERR